MAHSNFDEWLQDLTEYMQDGLNQLATDKQLSLDDTLHLEKYSWRKAYCTVYCTGTCLHYFKLFFLLRKAEMVTHGATRKTIL